jgi:hypothetical protein
LRKERRGGDHGGIEVGDERGGRGERKRKEGGRENREGEWEYEMRRCLASICSHTPLLPLHVIPHVIPPPPHTS